MSHVSHQDFAPCWKVKAERQGARRWRPVACCILAEVLQELVGLVCRTMSGLSQHFLLRLSLTTLCVSWTASGAKVPTVSSQTAKITFDLEKGHPVEQKLWGIFFEEVTAVPRLIRQACLRKPC